jgi:hypothetical protein
MNASVRARQLVAKADELRTELEKAKAILGRERPSVRARVHGSHSRKAALPAKGQIFRKREILRPPEKESEVLELLRSEHKHRKASRIGSRRGDVKSQLRNKRLAHYACFKHHVAKASAKADELHEQLRSLDKKDFSPSTFAPREAGRQAVAQMQEAEGGAWTGRELEERFELTPATLHKRRKDLRIVWWRNARNKFHYPKWQFRDNGTLVPGVAEVLQVFGSQDEWRVIRYFLSHRHQLGDQTPLALLLKGEVDKVLVHAKLHGEENTW